MWYNKSVLKRYAQKHFQADNGGKGLFFMTTIKFNGKVVGTNKTANRGDMAGYCGQKLKNGTYAVYVPAMGICSVVKGAEAETVEITGIVKPIAEIREEILASFRNNKKLAVMTETDNGETLEILEIPVNKSTIETILTCVSLNTTSSRCGVIIRDVKDNVARLAEIGSTVLRYPASDLLEIAEAYNVGNNGNFAEFLLSGNEADIFSRFRKKSIDCYVKLESFKTVRRWELKCSLITVNKSARSGASSTNMLSSFTM